MIVFVVVGGIVKPSSVVTGWGFAVVSLEAVLTCIVMCGKPMRPCVVSLTTLLFLIRCYLIFGHVSFFITTKCSANILSPISTSGVAVTNGFCNWQFATCI